jgi:hypothetical protein
MNSPREYWGQARQAGQGDRCVPKAVELEQWSIGKLERWGVEGRVQQNKIQSMAKIFFDSEPTKNRKLVCCEQLHLKL